MLIWVWFSQLSLSLELYILFSLANSTTLHHVDLNSFSLFLHREHAYIRAARKMCRSSLLFCENVNHVRQISTISSTLSELRRVHTRRGWITSFSYIFPPFLSWICTASQYALQLDTKVEPKWWRELKSQEHERNDIDDNTQRVEEKLSKRHQTIPSRHFRNFISFYDSVVA